MKLYTEEQVRLLLDLVKLKINGEMYSKDVLLEQVAPIELPSDMEIEEYLQKTHTKAVNPLNVYYRTGFESGAKWIKEQILNQNK